MGLSRLLGRSREQDGSKLWKGGSGCSHGSHGDNGDR